MTEKVQATKYILYRFSEWYKTMNPNSSSNDLSILKTLKLLFLLCTVKNNHKDQNLLDLYFDDFVAMPFGPVAIETYKYFLDETFINRNGLEFSALSSDAKLPNKEIIDNCVDELISKNTSLITLSASQLVDLTHKYSCWINNYNKGKAKNFYREEIPVEEIKKDEKFYFL